MRQISGGSPLRWAAPALLAASMPLVMHGLVQVVGSAPDPTEAGVVVGTMAWAAMPFVALAALALFGEAVAGPTMRRSGGLEEEGEREKFRGWLVKVVEGWFGRKE